MKEIKSRFSTGMECPKCKWGWITTEIDTIAEDNTNYKVWLEPGNSQDLGNIKLVAAIANVNYIKAKELLSSKDRILIYNSDNKTASTKSKAQRVQEIASRLKEYRISFTILPTFPYGIKSC